MMNHCAAQQKNALATREEMRGAFVPSVIASDRRDAVFCPKPRRIGHLSAAGPTWPLCSLLFSRLQSEPCDSRAGDGILDFILTEGAHGDVDEHAGSQIALSPPYFCGSPPSRSANPLVLDARFGEEKPTPLTPLPMIQTAAVAPSLSSSSAAGGARKGCARTKFGFKPAAVRVEGFDCDNRRSHHSIPAVA